MTFWPQVILTLGLFDPSWNISVQGHFGPRAFCPRTFWSLVISAWDILVPGHFSPVSCQFQVRFQGHFGQGSFQFLVISALSPFGQFIPGSFVSLVILAMGHVDPWSFRSLGHFDVVTFWPQVILILFHFDDPSWNTSVLGHFGSRAFCPRTFWSLFILAWVISVPSHFNPGSCQSQVIW